MLSVLTHEDLNVCGAGDLGEWLKEFCVSWLHLPVTDWRAPDAMFDEAWLTLGLRTLEILRGMGSVFVHCAAGLERSGTGCTPAVDRRRCACRKSDLGEEKGRPGDIETREGEVCLSTFDG